MESIELHFHGPFTFTPGAQSLFHSPYSAVSCVYLWTIQSERDGLYYIHYVGESTSFAARHREHLIHILGMDYGIFEPTEARNLVQKQIWPGMWRDRSPDGPARLLERYADSAADVLRYVEALTVFVAETNVAGPLRKHIEGSIGQNLRNNHRDKKALYPDDNHVGVGPRIGAQMRLSADAPIAGLDPVIEI